ncbi:hypothetical protein OAU26_03705 [Mariniblastus sp.]|nr:hypothetical protein [Mariniblastus sp.]
MDGGNANTKLHFKSFNRAFEYFETNNEDASPNDYEISVNSTNETSFQMLFDKAQNLISSHLERIKTLVVLLQSDFQIDASEEEILEKPFPLVNPFDGNNATNVVDFFVEEYNKLYINSDSDSETESDSDTESEREPFIREYACLVTQMFNKNFKPTDICELLQKIRAVFQEILIPKELCNLLIKKLEEASSKKSGEKLVFKGVIKCTDSEEFNTYVFPPESSHVEEGKACTSQEHKPISGCLLTRHDFVPNPFWCKSSIVPMIPPYLRRVGEALGVAPNMVWFHRPIQKQEWDNYATIYGGNAQQNMDSSGTFPNEWQKTFYLLRNDHKWRKSEFIRQYETQAIRCIKLACPHLRKLSTDVFSCALNDDVILESFVQVIAKCYQIAELHKGKRYRLQKAWKRLWETRRQFVADFRDVVIKIKNRQPTLQIQYNYESAKRRRSVL